MTENAKHLLDIASLTTLFAWAMSYLPSAATVLTFAWICFRLYNEVMVTADRRAARKAARHIVSDLANEG